MIRRKASCVWAFPHHCTARPPLVKDCHSHDVTYTVVSKQLCLSSAQLQGNVRSTCNNCVDQIWRHKTPVYELSKYDNWPHQQNTGMYWQQALTGLTSHLRVQLLPIEYATQKSAPSCDARCPSSRLEQLGHLIGLKCRNSYTHNINNVYLFTRQCSHIS